VERDNERVRSQASRFPRFLLGCESVGMPNENWTGRESMNWHFYQVL